MQHFFSIENCGQCRVTIKKSLQHKIDNSLPTPFVLTHTNLCIFIIKNDKAIEFNFHEHVHAQMGWFYFKLNIMASRDNNLVTLEYSKSAVKCALLPSATENKDTYYTAVVNNLMTLNINGNFNVHSAFLV